MIAIGIPSYNEADNIASLVYAIDHAATSLNIDIVFVNADNNSPDLTAKIFQKVKTNAKKVSLTTSEKGKGNNLKAIIDYITMRDDIVYCMFIDADISSFDAKWLINHAESNDRGYDYVIPNYSRNMQEGNTTNHFIYPLLFNLTDGNAPYQGIAGDFGISKRFADYLSQQTWPRSSLGYGVDIFMTMHALCSGVRIKEIVLERKIHKPSFDKMVGMFQEVAESYFETRNNLSFYGSISFARQSGSKLSLLPGKSIPANKLKARRSAAIELLLANENNSLHISYMPDTYEISIEDWVDILIKHERSRQIYTPAELALSLTPFYLLRVLTYLNTSSNPEKAINQINQTAILLRKNFGVAA